jgi:cbb3-type cytochrome c oxidase subunit II
MKMTPVVTILGSVLLFWVSFGMVVLLPTYTIPQQPSALWRQPTPAEARGRLLYIANGCGNCHSQYVRPQDWDEGAERIAQSGDYYLQSPVQLGSERTGPDLSQEGGEHPDDWHLAHFTDPRFTRPMSLMPQFSFYDRQHLADLTAYVQSLGGKDADYRVARQRYWKPQAVAAYQAGADKNIAWLHDHVPDTWRYMPNPYPPTPAALARGQRTYEMFCIGCHGPVGDGQGPAAPYLLPPPLNFTTLRRNLAGGRFIGGIIYYQVMNGITGTDMPYFKKELESAKIWDVSNFVAANFIGYTDFSLNKGNIAAAYEGPAPPAPGGTGVSPVLPEGDDTP